MLGWSEAPGEGGPECVHHHAYVLFGSPPLPPPSMRFLKSDPLLLPVATATYDIRHMSRKKRSGPRDALGRSVGTDDSLPESNMIYLPAS